jgi:hypothetical protein
MTICLPLGWDIQGGQLEENPSQGELCEKSDFPSAMRFLSALTLWGALRYWGLQRLQSQLGAFFALQQLWGGNIQVVLSPVSTELNKVRFPLCHEVFGSFDIVGSFQVLGPSKALISARHFFCSAACLGRKYPGHAGTLCRIKYLHHDNMPAAGVGHPGRSVGGNPFPG